MPDYRTMRKRSRLSSAKALWKFQTDPLPTFSFVSPDVWERDFAKSQTIQSWFESFENGAPTPLVNLIDTPKVLARFLKGRGGLDIIYSHLGLSNVDLDLATKLGGASIGQAKKNFLSIHRRLADGIEASIKDKEYDLILIDCPPNFNIVTKTAIISSDYILVPACPDYLSTLGISYLLRSVDALIKDYNDFAEVNAGQQTPKIDPRYQCFSCGSCRALMAVIYDLRKENTNERLLKMQRFELAKTKQD